MRLEDDKGEMPSHISPISRLHLPYISPVSPLKVRLEDDKGEMPLHKLSRQGSMASVRALVERSAKV